MKDVTLVSIEKHNHTGTINLYEDKNIDPDEYPYFWVVFNDGSIFDIKYNCYARYLK